MLCYAMLCYAMLCYAILYYILPCYTILYFTKVYGQFYSRSIAERAVVNKAGFGYATSTGRSRVRIVGSAMDFQNHHFGRFPL